MRMTFDVAEVEAGLEKLEDQAYKVARSMGVAAGQALRDEAQSNVGVKSGKLRSAIYVAYDSKDSTPSLIRYNVSWNHKKAPHGWLVEFGHYRYNVVVMKPDGTWFSTTERLDTPVRVKPVAYLRRSMDTMRPRLLSISVSAGKRRFAELSAGGADVEAG